MTNYMKVSILTTLLFLGLVAWHFGTVFGLFGIAPVGQSGMVFRVFIILGIVIVTAFMFAYRHGKVTGSAIHPDEREEKIERYSEAAGVLTIYAGLLCLLWFLFLPMSPMQVANALLAIVFITELVKMLVVLAFLRRGVV